MSQVKQWIKKYPLWSLLTLSIIIHFIILSFIQWDRLPKEKEKIFEVELVTKPIKITLSPKKATLIKIKQAGSKAKTQYKTSPAINTKSAPPKPSILIQSRISGIGFRRKTKTIDNEIKTVSRKRNRLDSDRTLINLDKISNQTEKKEPWFSTAPKKKLEAAIAGIQAGEIINENRYIPVEPGISNLAQPNISFKAANYRINGEKEKNSLREGNGNSQIEGEISKRKIIFKPKPPKLNSDKNVTISLRFTVLPNGAVDQIVPHTKADPALELLAIKLLRQYRFAPLVGSDETQSGIIHFSNRKNIK